MEALPLPTDHSSSFRLFYDSVETHFRGLGSLGEKTETYWDILAPIIQKKLPNGIKKNLARQNENKKWQIDNLRKAILNEIEILDQVRTVLVIMISPPIDQRPTKRTCLFCEGEHSANDWNVVTDKGKRYSIVRDARACLNCFNRHSDLSASHGTDVRCATKNIIPSFVKMENHLLQLNQQLQTRFQVHTPQTRLQHLQSHPTTLVILTDTHLFCWKQLLLLLEVTSTISVRTFYSTKAHNADVMTKLDLKPETQETISLWNFGGNTSVKRIDTATIYLETAKEEPIPIRVIIVQTIAVPLTTYTGATSQWTVITKNSRWWFTFHSWYSNRCWSLWGHCGKRSYQGSRSHSSQIRDRVPHLGSPI